MEHKKGWLSEEDYNFVCKRVPRLCVDLVIKGEHGVLFSLRAIEPQKGNWHLPGGRVFKGEKIEETIARIAQEETGLSVETEKCLGYMEFLDEVQDGHERHTVSMVFLVRVTGGELKPDFQSGGLEYFTEIPQPFDPIHKDFLLEQEVFGKDVMY
jgi:ADP-ribose pyrophosphatase YjhB (NUDIX family)